MDKLLEAVFVLKGITHCAALSAAIFSAPVLSYILATSGHPWFAALVAVSWIWVANDTLRDGR
jgi:hypothetical protein